MSITRHKWGKLSRTGEFLSVDPDELFPANTKPPPALLGSLGPLFGGSMGDGRTSSLAELTSVGRSPQAHGAQA